jgi:hypothetical protein
MGKTSGRAEALTRPLLLPGTLACRALGFHGNDDLVAMLINSLVWTVLGIVVVVLAV